MCKVQLVLLAFGFLEEVSDMGSSDEGLKIGEGWGKVFKGEGGGGK